MHIQKTHHTCGEECKRTVGSLIWSSESPHRPAPSIASLAPQAKTFFLLNKSWPHLLFPKVFFFSTHTYSTSNWLVNRKGERSHRFQSCSFLSIDQRGGIKLKSRIQHPRDWIRQRCWTYILRKTQTFVEWDICKWQQLVTISSWLYKQCGTPTPPHPINSSLSLYHVFASKEEMGSWKIWTKIHSFFQLTCM